jgi:lysosomal acid phosphatase
LFVSVSAFVGSSGWKELNDASRTLLQNLNPVFNTTFLPHLYPILDVTNVNDVFFCDEAHGTLYSNYPLLTPALRNTTLALTVQFLQIYNSFPYAVKRILAGRLVSEIINVMDAVITNASVLRLLHYSAHDSTVQPLLMALEVFDGTPVPYVNDYSLLVWW